MSRHLTDEERLLRDTVRDFAQREVAPGAVERDEAERYDRSLFRSMGALGLTAAPFETAVGGAGFSYLAWTLVMEELGAADMAAARGSERSWLSETMQIFNFLCRIWMMSQVLNWRHN